VEARSYLTRALACQSSPTQQALLRRKLAAVETDAPLSFGSRVENTQGAVAASLEAYWPRGVNSFKPDVESEQEPDPLDSSER
jgi:hypothetical protein